MKNLKDTFRDKIELKLMLWFTVIYLITFTILAIINKNFEFLYYTFIISILVFIIAIYHKKFHLTKHTLFGLTLLGAVHIFGGNIHINNMRLYDMWLIPNILKYDNLVHLLGTFVVTFIIYSLIAPALNNRIKKNNFELSLMLILIATGFWSFIEIIELGAVLFLNASQQVGDYLNNALDLVFNLIGSIAACLFIKYNKRKK